MEREGAAFIGDAGSKGSQDGWAKLHLDEESSADATDDGNLDPLVLRSGKSGKLSKKGEESPDPDELSGLSGGAVRHGVIMTELAWFVGGDVDDE